MENLGSFRILPNQQLRTSVDLPKKCCMKSKTYLLILGGNLQLETKVLRLSMKCSERISFSSYQSTF